MRTAIRSIAAGAAACLMAAASGCYSTTIQVPSDVPRGESYTDRQWFLLYGLVPLDEVSGEECQYGIADVESESSAIDVAISIGLTAVGIAGGLLLCDDIDDSLGELACAQAVALGTNLVGSRTVRYTCVAGPPVGAELLIPTAPSDQPVDEASPVPRSLVRR